MSEETKPLTFTDPEIRRVTVDQLSEMTGIPAPLLRRGAKAGKFEDKGILFIPSDTNADEGTYLVALKPFLNWWCGRAVTARQTTDDTVQSIRRIQVAEQINALLADVA